MKLWSEVIAAVASGTVIVLEMNEGINDQESVLESGMRCRVVSVADEDVAHDVVCIRLDMAPFRDHNILLESPDYYDAARVPCLTATQAGLYPADHIETIYVSPTDEIAIFGRVMPAQNIELYGRYLTEKSETGMNLSYVMWLENELLSRT